MSIRDLVPKLTKSSEEAPARRPTDPLVGFQRRMNDLFDELFGEFLIDPPDSRGESGWPTAMPGFSPRVDVSQTARQVKVIAELAGMDEDDITVELDDAALIIRGEKRQEEEEKGDQWYRRETSWGAFHRVVPLPASVQTDKAKARFKKGRLTVTIPKREQESSAIRKIAITAE